MTEYDQTKIAVSILRSRLELQVVAVSFDLKNQNSCQFDKIEFLRSSKSTLLTRGHLQTNVNTMSAFFSTLTFAFHYF